MRRPALSGRVSGLVMVGFDGTLASQAPAHFIADLAGAILFKRNVVDAKQTAELVAGLQDMAGRRAGASLLIGIDQEGGTVSRLSGFGTTTPSAMALGVADDEALTQSIYALIAVELAALGVNLDYAPVADVNNNPDNPVIGVRSFGQQPSSVSRHVGAAIRGLHESGVGATAKHFPGHGDTSIDSHLDLPFIPHTLDRLRSLELEPFRAAIAAGVDAIMTAHIVFSAVDDRLPATLSRRVLGGLLREELGYDGVICTDCLEMRAIATRYPPAVAAVQAVSAGADLLLFSHDVEKARSAVLGLQDAVSSGELEARQIERSLERVGRLRARLTAASRSGLAGGATANRPLAAVGSAAHRETAKRAAQRALTLIRDPRKLLPLRLSPDDKIFLVQFVGSVMTPVEDGGQTASVLATELRRSHRRIQEQVRSLDPSGHEYKQLLMASASASLVIAITRRAWQHALQAQAVSDLAMLGKPVIAVAAREPYDADVLPPGITVLATYGDDDITMRCAADLIVGKNAASGEGFIARNEGAPPGTLAPQ